MAQRTIKPAEDAVLNFAVNFIDENNRMPNSQEIADQFGFSRQRAYAIIHKLRQSGRLVLTVRR